MRDIHVAVVHAADGCIDLEATKDGSYFFAIPNGSSYDKVIHIALEHGLQHSIVRC